LNEHESDSTVTRLACEFDGEHGAVSSPISIHVEIPDIPDQRTPADARDHLSLARPLVGAGVGVGFLDGLMRVDLARALRSPQGLAARSVRGRHPLIL